MGHLDGRVAIVTGAGRGLGREHALLLAREGASVVVNDLGGDTNGIGADAGPAQQVVDEIMAMGGRAVANGDSVTSWNGAKRLIDQAVESFGDLHVLVNNAGFLRDRVLVNMEEADWDSVIDVHLKGHFCTARHAAAYWRDQSKAGKSVNASMIHTASVSGTAIALAGQGNYGSAKAAIAHFSAVCAVELARYGVRSNAITPNARTRLTMESPATSELMKAPDDEAKFDRFSPANVSPMVAYLATADCPFTGEVFHVEGDFVARYRPYGFAEKIKAGRRRWTVDQLIAEAGALKPAEAGTPATEQRP